MTGPPAHAPSYRLACSYLPGPLAALVSDDLVLLGDIAPGSALLDACWAAVDAGAGVDGLLGVIADVGLRHAPSFALVGTGDPGTAEPGLRLLLRGRATARQGARGFGADGSSTWTEHRVPTPAGVAGGSPDELCVVLDGRPTDGAYLPMGRGIALASAVTIAARAIPARSSGGHAARPATGTDTAGPLAMSAPSVPPEQPTVEAPFAAWGPPTGSPLAGPPPGVTGVVPALALTDPVPAYVPPRTTQPNGPDSGPLVPAVLCRNGHLNAPGVVGACRVCGAPVPLQQAFLAPRPVLGLLTLSTGDTVTVDRDVLLGRAPVVAAPDSARAVPLSSPNNDLSRSHARVHVDGWLIQVIDLDSTNGTVVTMPGQQAVRLRANEPFTVVPGTVVSMGDEVTFRFEVPA